MTSVPYPGYSEAKRAANHIQSRWPIRPRIGMILGSGLQDVVAHLRDPLRLPYRTIPHFPRPTVAGHGGVLHMGWWGKTPVAILEGRVHLYEGYAPAEVVFPVRVLALVGVHVLVATCAAGGIAAQAVPGGFMIFSDHLNLQGTNPLVGPHDKRWGAQFHDMSQAYDPALRSQARKAARRLRLRCFEGIYASVLGPSYETPAEIRAYRRLGADAVGMSTVPEVIAARQLGLRVLALAAITNRAAGLTRKQLSHAEVLEVGKRAARDLARLCDLLLPKLAGASQR